MTDKRTFKEVEGPTPSGGVKSVVFFSKNGKPSAESDADRCEIHELDENGEVIARTYGEMN